MNIVCDGLPVRLSEWGRGDPLVLVHGLGEDHRAWRAVVPHLALRRRVIAYDLRGHGETPPGELTGTLAQLGSDLLAVLDAMELDKADLCGFSLGGTVVLRAGIDAPWRVRQLVPVATSSRVGAAAAAWYEERAGLADRGPHALEPVLEQDTRQQLQQTPELLADQWLLRRQAVADPRGFANACRAMARLHEEPLDPELSAVEAPTLVIAGERDPLCPPRAAEIVAAGIPGARMMVMPDSSHMLPVERPAELSALLLDFLESSPGG